MERPERKLPRLKEYDYSQGGAYFVTICTKNRENLFWDNYSTGAAACHPCTGSPNPSVGAAISRPPLSRYGKIAEDAILSIPVHYPNAAADLYVVMPNHIHLILRISETDGRQVAAPTLSRVIGGMKWHISREIGRPVFQRSYYDHVIRGEADYQEIAQYIVNNPAKWAEDKYYL